MAQRKRRDEKRCEGEAIVRRERMMIFFLFSQNYKDWEGILGTLGDALTYIGKGGKS